MKLFVIKDKKSNKLTETFLEVNMACAVRYLRAICDEDAINRRLGRLTRWDDSVLYELSYTDDLKNISITGSFLLRDVVNLKHDADAEARNKELEKKLAQAAENKKQEIKELLSNETVKN